MRSYLVLKIWPFNGPGYWGGYLGASRCSKTVKILAIKGLSHLPGIIPTAFISKTWAGDEWLREWLTTGSAIALVDDDDSFFNLDFDRSGLSSDLKKIKKSSWN